MRVILVQTHHKIRPMSAFHISQIIIYIRPCLWLIGLPCGIINLRFMPIANPSYLLPMPGHCAVIAYDRSHALWIVMCSIRVKGNAYLPGNVSVVLRIWDGMIDRWIPITTAYHRLLFLLPSNPYTNQSNRWEWVTQQIKLCHISAVSNSQLLGASLPGPSSRYHAVFATPVSCWHGSRITEVYLSAIPPTKQATIQ